MWLWHWILLFLSITDLQTNVNRYISRITDDSSADQNPFIANSLPFAADSFADFVLWNNRMNPTVHDDAKSFIEAAVSACH